MTTLPHQAVSQVVSHIDAHFDSALDAGHAPGMSYAVVADGAVVHERGLGTVDIMVRQVPDAETAFRIASMTKSFTAMTVLSLRDRGLLQLDQPVITWVPELAAGGEDARCVTVRHLLTMGAGFATDDPWGDRQQDLPLQEFRALLASGIRPVTRPGDRFEYSNLGYALLGLVISAVTGQPYPEAVREWVLAPLALGNTGFEPGDLTTRTVAKGYVRRSDGWQVEPVAGVGAFAPMGGLLSTVSDLAVWVAAFSGRAAACGVVSELSLREMQRTQRLAGGTASASPDEPPTVWGYGFGLFEEFGSVGRTVFHSGGYPGFGSHMRWHPASGLAVVALANGTYAPMSTVGAAALTETIRQVAAPTRPVLPGVDGLERAEAAVAAWLAAADPDGPESIALRALWADNVERDLPWPERVRSWRALRQQFGQLVVVPGSRWREGAAAVRWDLGPSADSAQAPVRVSLLLAPHDTCLIQSLTVRARTGDQPPRASIDPW